MKILTLSLLVLLCFACENENIVAPNDSELEAEEVITESDVVNEVFSLVEDMPRFPGGNEAYYQFLGRQINYPKQAIELGIEGKVHLSFVVNEDGSLSDLQLVKGIGGGCDQEALEAFLNSPAWEPGKQRGRNVKTRMQAAVTFELGNKGEAMFEPQAPQQEQKEELTELIIEELAIASK